MGLKAYFGHDSASAKRRTRKAGTARFLELPVARHQQSRPRVARPAVRVRAAQRGGDAAVTWLRPGSSSWRFPRDALIVLQSNSGHVPTSAFAVESQEKAARHDRRGHGSLQMRAASSHVMNGTRAVRDDLDQNKSLSAIVMGGRGVARSDPDLSLAGADHFHSPRATT